MTTEMAFLPELRQFLRSHGEIYTVRKYTVVEKDVEVPGVGVCRRIPVMDIADKSQLEPYVGLSGFLTVQTWWSKILEFVPYLDDRKFLYHVVCRGEE